jgi:hypothetical protein
VIVYERKIPFVLFPNLRAADFLLGWFVNMFFKPGRFATFVLVAAFLTGCTSTPPVDWNSRVGTYTYDQAVTELGPPDRQAKLDNGQTVAQWISRRNSGSGFNVGTGYASAGGGSAVGVGAGQSIGTSPIDQTLKLTFGTNSVLTAWSKNY